MSYVIKVNKPSKPRKALAIGKTRQQAETRAFPKYREGMTTLDYVRAYHAANAAVHLTPVVYACR